MGVFRVLLVDDEEDLVNTMVERLQIRGLAADGVYSGDDALLRLDQEEYDAVVVDLKMPGLSGTELIAKIRGVQPDARIILITGHGAIRDDSDEVIDGADSFLVKPFDIGELIRMIKGLPEPK